MTRLTGAALALLPFLWACSAGSGSYPSLSVRPGQPDLSPCARASGTPLPPERPAEPSTAETLPASELAAYAERIETLSREFETLAGQYRNRLAEAERLGTFETTPNDRALLSLGRLEADLLEIGAIDSQLADIELAFEDPAQFGRALPEGIRLRAQIDELSQAHRSRFDQAAARAADQTAATEGQAPAAQMCAQDAAS